LKRASSSQIHFSFRATRGLPFAVSTRAIARAARRAFREYPVRPRSEFALLRYLEGVALLNQLRRQHRAAVRELRRAGCRGSAAAYACTPEGRRANAAIDALMERIALEQASLCG
jgi:hypothetical protein